jgi:hypothetical protein
MSLGIGSSVNTCKNKFSVTATRQAQDLSPKQVERAADYALEMTQRVKYALMIVCSSCNFTLVYLACTFHVTAAFHDMAQ